MQQRTFRVLTAASLVVVAGFLLWMIGGWGGLKLLTWVDDWGELVAATLGSGACAYAATKHRRYQRIGWAMMAISTGSWAAGELYWAWNETLLNRPNPFPSLADAGFLGAVPFQILAVLVLATGFRHSSRVRTLVDGLILAFALLFLSWVSVLGTVYRQGADTPFALTLSLAYPISDIVTAVIVLTIASHSRRFSGALGFIAVGLFSLTVSDSTFTYLNATNAFASNPVDTGWVLGFLLIGLGAIRSMVDVEESADRRGTGLRVAIPYVPLAAVAAVTLLRFFERQPLDMVAGAMVGVIVALVLLRQLLAVVEVSRLSKDLESSLHEIQDREAQLEYQAFHDNLTKLANRQLFQDRVEHALSRAKRSQRAMALLYLDLDDFKTVNDTMGHAAGDQLLIAASERLRACVRPGDTIARFGGDEFAVLLEDITEHAEAVAVARRMLDAFEAPFDLQRDVYMSMSVGIVFASRADVRMEDLLRDADAAMYAAKGGGRGRYAVFEENLRSAFAERLELRTRLARAIEERAIDIHYQPIYDLGSRRLVGAEALARWTCDGTPIPPSEFIPLAEKSGLIAALGRLVLEDACREAATWVQPAGSRSLSLAVNVSAFQLNHAGFVDDVRRVVAEARLEPRQLVLEITENSLMHDTATVLTRLNDLTALGVRIAIDDFGTGFSALHYLQRFPVSIVKIDKSFVDGLGSPTNRAVVASIANLCESLGMISVAEGIETASQYAQLRELACKAGQGYLLSRPMPADEIRRLLDGTPQGVGAQPA